MFMQPRLQVATFAVLLFGSWWVFLAIGYVLGRTEAKWVTPIINCPKHEGQP
jgi:hypothetical protein